MFRSRKAALAVLAGGISAALLLSTGSGALAAGASNVVAPSGKVAGHGYAYWLARNWQSSYSVSGPVNACRTLTANGQRVAWLMPPSVAPATYAYTCSEPAGRPLDVIELSHECSTFHGDHNGFGTTAADLQRCARMGFKGAKETTTIDGHPADVSKLIAATVAYRVHASKNNMLGQSPGQGLSAAYGYALLLDGLSKGTHTIHTVMSVGNFRWDVTFTVHAH
jgi:hypothetical protein